MLPVLGALLRWMTNPGSQARDANGNLLFDANGHPVITPYGGSGGSAIAPPGGGGGGGATGATTGKAAAGYTTGQYGGGLIPATGTAATTSGVLSTAAQVLPWVKFAASYLESQKSGKFVQPPMSPEQKAMFDWSLDYLKGFPDNRSAIDAILKFDLGHPSTINMEALKAGKVGYTPQGHMPGVDLASVIRNQAGSNGSAPPPTSGYNGGQQGIADIIRGIQSP